MNWKSHGGFWVCLGGFPIKAVTGWLSLKRAHLKMKKKNHFKYIDSQILNSLIGKTMLLASTIGREILQPA